MGMRFKWIEWNRDHIARHGVSEREVEEVLVASDSVHRLRRDGTMASSGRTAAGRELIVIWKEQDATDVLVDLQSEVFVITAYGV